MFDFKIKVLHKKDSLTVNKLESVGSVSQCLLYRTSLVVLERTLTNQVHQRSKKTVGENQTDIAAMKKLVIGKQHSVTIMELFTDTYETLSDDFNNDMKEIRTFIP